MATDPLHPGARRVAALQAATVASLLLASVLVAAAAHPAALAAGPNSTIGRTWPIAEPDAMA